MDYAIQLLIPILGGLFIGVWLQNTFGMSPLWTVGLAILGMIAGLGIIYKRLQYPELYKDDPSMPIPKPLKPTSKKESEPDD